MELPKQLGRVEGSFSSDLNQANNKSNSQDDKDNTEGSAFKERLSQSLADQIHCKSDGVNQQKREDYEKLLSDTDVDADSTEFKNVIEKKIKDQMNSDMPVIVMAQQDAGFIPESMGSVAKFMPEQTKEKNVEFSLGPAENNVSENVNLKTNFLNDTLLNRHLQQINEKSFKIEEGNSVKYQLRNNINDDEHQIKSGQLEIRNSSTPHDQNFQENQLLLNAQPILMTEKDIKKLNQVDISENKDSAVSDITKLAVNAINQTLQNMNIKHVSQDPAPFIAQRDRILPERIEHAETIMQSLQDGENTIHTAFLKIYPPELGPVIAKIKMNDRNQAELKLLTNNEQTKEMILSSINQIKENFSQADVLLQKIDVQHDMDSFNKDLSFANQKQEKSFQSKYELPNLEKEETKPSIKFISKTTSVIDAYI